MFDGERMAGMFGGTVIADTEIHPGNWFCLAVIEAAVIEVDETTAANLENLDDLDEKELAAGVVIYGHFTAIQLASGTVIAYKREP